MPKKLALTIGINKFPRSPLRGCVNDSNMMKKLLEEKFGYDVIQLLDENATRSAITSTVNSMAAKSNPGDSFVIHASSHGTQVRDRNGEEKDGLDEALVCFFREGQDFMQHLLIDDDFNDLIKKFNPKCNVTFVMDCCHSGTSTRQALFGNSDIIPRFISPPNARDGAPAVYQEKNILSYWLFKFLKLFGNQPKTNKLINGDVMGVVLSACKDSQTAADARIDDDYYGAFSRNLVKAIEKSRSLEVKDIYEDTVDAMKSRFKQSPQLKSNDPKKLTSKIFM